MAILSVPIFEDKDRNKEQELIIEGLSAEGWLKTGTQFDRITKKKIAIILMKPDKSQIDHFPNQSVDFSGLIKNNFRFGEPVKIVSNPDKHSPSSMTNEVIGKTGKFLGLTDNGGGIYGGYAIVKFDEYLYFLHDCDGRVLDFHGLYCHLDSLVSLDPKSEQEKPIIEGCVVRVTDGQYIGKEGVCGKLDFNNNNADVLFFDSYGTECHRVISIKNLYPVSVYTPDHAVTLDSGDIVKLISLDAINLSSTVAHRYIGSTAYVNGPLFAKTGIQKDKTRIQITFFKDHRSIEVDVNCVEVIPQDQIFPGIKIGDLVTIIGNPDISKPESSLLRSWVGKKLTFLGFPEDKDITYRYKYFAKLKYKNSELFLYASPGSIAKLSKDKYIPKIGDKVKALNSKKSVIHEWKACYSELWGTIVDVYLDVNNEIDCYQVSFTNDSDNNHASLLIKPQNFIAYEEVED